MTYSQYRRYLKNFASNLANDLVGRLTVAAKKFGINSVEHNNNIFDSSQPAFTCSKLTIETLEQGVKYVQS